MTGASIALSGMPMPAAGGGHWSLPPTWAQRHGRCILPWISPRIPWSRDTL